MDSSVIANLIGELVAEHPDNVFTEGIRYYDEPLVAFAAADDPLFTGLQEAAVVGDIFRLPAEWLPGAQTVISYFLPFSQAVRQSNYAQSELSLPWLHGRFRGESFNNTVRRALVDFLSANGGRAVAPLLEKEFRVDYGTFRSSWSERHVAYIAGLGTFSLNRGMITAKGMAGRFGSVITDLSFPPTARDYTGPFERCPQLAAGACGACIARCPIGAITPAGKDNALCYHFLHHIDPLKAEREKHGYPYSACGKCQTGVPCETGIPGTARR